MGHAADHAREEAAVVRNFGPAFASLRRGKLRIGDFLLRQGYGGQVGFVIGDGAEAEGINRADGARAHGEDVADDAAQAGGGALERLDRAGMIVRLDFKRDGQPVADVNNTGIFLPRADEDARRLGGKGLEERPGVFVGAMLAPHDGEDAQFGVSRFASKQRLDLLVLLGSEIVLLDQFRSDGWFGHGINQFAKL